MANCVVILKIKNKKFEESYRVAMVDSLNQLFYDDILETISQDPLVILGNCRMVFKECQPILTRELAYILAEELQSEHQTKDGIKLINLPTSLEEF